MKLLRLVPLIFLCCAEALSIPVNVQKTDSLNNTLTGNVVAGNGVSITATGTGTIVATSAPAGGITGIVSGLNGGTGVANQGAITIGGNLTTVGAFPLTFNIAGNTSVALPTSGTLLTTTGDAAQLTNSALTVGRVPFAGSAGKLMDSSALTFNSGTGAISATSFVGAGTSLTGIPYSVKSIADLRLFNAASLSDGAQITVGSYYGSGPDGGGGIYTWNSTSTTADNGGTVIAPTGIATGRWVFQGTPTVNTFGAHGDGSTDDTDAIANAISAINDTATGPNNSVYAALIFPPGGKYLITSPLVIRISNLSVVGNSCEIIAGSSMTAVIQLGQTGYNTPQSDSFNDLLLNCNNNASYGVYITQGAAMTMRCVNVSNPVSSGFYSVGSTTTTIDGIDFINCLVQIPGTTAKGFFFNQGNITPGAFTGFHLFNCGVQGGGVQVESSGSSTNYAKVDVYGGIFDNADSYCFFATSFGAIQTFGTFGETNNQPTAYVSSSGKIYAFGGGLGPTGTGQGNDGTGLISQVPDVYGTYRIGSYFNVTLAGAGGVLVSSFGTSSGTALNEFFGSGGKSMQLQTNSDGSINIYTGATTGTIHSGGTNALSLDTTGTLGVTNNLQLGGTTFFGPSSADLNFNMRGSGVHRFTFNSTIAVASNQCGTFVANGASPVVVSNTAVTSKSTFSFGIIAAGGTITSHPYLVSQTAGTGFTVQASAGDTSTYRYVIIEGN